MEENSIVGEIYTWGSAKLPSPEFELGKFGSLAGVAPVYDAGIVRQRNTLAVIAGFKGRELTCAFKILGK